MLSPCIWQVTHALLTRPPLTFKSLSFIKSPFDLHVLSTPPAFILSQDQTLMLKVDSRTSYNWLPISRLLYPVTISNHIYCFRFCSLNNSFQEFSGLHYCLFVKVLTALSHQRSLDIISCIANTVKQLIQLFLIFFMLNFFTISR